MNSFWATLLFFIIGFSAYGQDWLKNAVPLDLDQTCLIVEKIDSIGPRCKEGKRLIYCNDFDKNIDKQLLSLQKQQENAFQKYRFEYLLILPKAFPYQEYTDLKDTHKYRYVLKIHFYQSPEGSDFAWLYYFYDRQTKKTYPRIHQIKDNRFKSLRDLISQLNDKFGSAEKK
jgi:hypothetical protein